MADSVAAVPDLAAARGIPGASTRTGLEAQLETCRRQLGGWQGCAAARTPEGRKIILNLGARISAIERRIEALDAAAARGGANRPAAAVASPAVPPQDSPLALAGPAGTRIDAYA